MPIYFTRFKPDRIGIRNFLHSDQLDDALKGASQDVIAHAIPGSSTLAPEWYQERGPALRIGTWSRITRFVRNDHRAAAAIEFGSGRRNWQGGGERRQGGDSDPKRILGKAGARVGDKVDEVG